MRLEYVEGTDLSEVSFNLEKKEIDSFMDQLAKLQSIMMSISFPAGGSIFYARLEAVVWKRGHSARGGELGQSHSTPRTSREHLT